MTTENARIARRTYLLSWLPVLVVILVAGAVIGGTLALVAGLLS